MALWGSTQLVKPKTSAVRQIACLSPTQCVTQGMLEVVREVEDSNAHIVFVGPTKAGKSTLINAMLGRLAVPSGALPNTLLPVSFYSDGVEDICYAVYLEGDGLDEFLGVELAFRDLDSKEAFEKVAEINSLARIAMRAVDDFQQLLDRFPSLCEWRLEVNVPSAENGDRILVTLTDCPGGSEGGVTGMAVQAFLAHQVESSALNVLVVRTDNITALQTPHRVASFFGGRIGSCASSADRDLRPQTVLVVNGVKDAATRQGIEEMIAGAAMHESLRSLDVVRTFFLDVLTQLAHQLCNQILNAVQEQRPRVESLSASDDPEIAGGVGSAAASSAQDNISEFLQACGLGSFTSLLADEGVEEIDFLRNLEEVDVAQVARDVGMKPMQVKQFLRRWASLGHEGGALAGAGGGAPAADARPELPEFATPQFKRFQSELTVIFHACCLEADLEDAYDEECKAFPRRLERAVGRGYTDENAFNEFFAHHLAVSWPEILTKFMLIKCLEMAMRDAKRHHSLVLATAVPAEEARLHRQFFEDVSLEIGLPDNLEAFRSSIEQELGFLPGMALAKEAMDRASRLLGDETEGGNLTALVVEQATDREFAISWEANAGDAVLPIYIMGRCIDQTYSHGRRVIPSRENARALVNAYNDWCCRRVDEVVLSGRVATESAGRWLASELPQHAEMVSTLPAPDRRRDNIIRPHLPRSKRNTRSSSGVLAESYLVVEKRGASQTSAASKQQSIQARRNGINNPTSRETMSAWKEQDVFIIGTGCKESSFFKKPVVDQDGEFQPVRKHGSSHAIHVELLPTEFWAGVAHQATAHIIRYFSELGTKAAQRRLDELIADTNSLESHLAPSAEVAFDRRAKATEVVARLQALRH